MFAERPSSRARLHLDVVPDAPRTSSQAARPGGMATLPIDTRLCYRFRCLGGTIWEIPGYRSTNLQIWEGKMQGRCFFQAVMLIGLLALAGCQSPKEALLEEGYKPATTDELTALYSGKTVGTSHGSDYYGPDGSYVSLWRGTIYKGTWRAEEPNKLCWDVAEWGSIPCSENYLSGDNIVGVFKGKRFERTSADFAEGNTIE